MSVVGFRKMNCTETVKLFITQFTPIYL